MPCFDGMAEFPANREDKKMTRSGVAAGQGSGGGVGLLGAIGDYGLMQSKVLEFLLGLVLGQAIFFMQLA